MEKRTRLKVSLVTFSDIKEFVDIVTENEGETAIENSDGTYRVNARSFLGAIAAVGDWDSVWVISDNPNLYRAISKFVV